MFKTLKINTKIYLMMLVMFSALQPAKAQSSFSYSGVLINDLITRIKAYDGVSRDVEFNDEEGERSKMTMDQVAEKLSEECFSPQSKHTVKKNELSRDNQTFVELSCAKNPDVFRNIVNVFVTLDGQSRVIDLQILNAHQKEDRNGEIIKATIGLSMGALVSGLLVARMYPGQRDKIEHSIAGSLVAAATLLVAHYSFKLDENKSMWLAIAAALVAGCLKEQLDKTHPQKHTVDSRDITATVIGGLLPAVAFRVQFSFKSILGI